MQYCNALLLKVTFLNTGDHGMDWVMAAENSAFSLQDKLHLNIYKYKTDILNTFPVFLIK